MPPHRASSRFLSLRRFDAAVGERDGGRGQRGRPPGPVVQRRQQRKEEAARESAQGVGADPPGLVVRAPLQRLPFGTGKGSPVQADSAVHTTGTHGSGTVSSQRRRANVREERRKRRRRTVSAWLNHFLCRWLTNT